MATDNIAVARRLIEEVWNKGNLGVIDQLVADGFVGHQPFVGEVRGLAAFRSQVEMYRRAFPDVHMTIEDIGTAGDRVFVRWVGRGTHRGAFLGIAPTNRAGEIRGMAVSKLAGGRIVEQHEIFDTAALLQILGAVPPIDRIFKVEEARTQHA
jgi:steroid delta-isomerase-like uncharacterized protein